MVVESHRAKSIEQGVQNIGTKGSIVVINCGDGSENRKIGKLKGILPVGWLRNLN